MLIKPALFILSLAFSNISYAEFIGPGSSATSTVSTIKSLSNLKNDQKATIEGFIVQKIKSEHYRFTDATGEIEVEIDDKDFRGIKVTPKTKVRLTGEIDKDLFSSSFEADIIELVK